MNEYLSLLQRYGVASPTRQTAPVGEAPTDITDPNYAEDLATYQANLAEQQRYQQGFDQRSQAFDLYGPGWSGDTLQGAKFGSRKPKSVSPAVAQIIANNLGAAPQQGSGGGNYSGPQAPGRDLTKDPLSPTETKVLSGVQGLLGFVPGGMVMNSLIDYNLGRQSVNDLNVPTPTSIGGQVGLNRGLGMGWADSLKAGLQGGLMTGMNQLTGNWNQNYSNEGRNAPAPTYTGPMSVGWDGSDATGGDYGGSASAMSGGGAGSSGEGTSSATGGNNGDASGGGDTGTRGGFAEGGLAELGDKYEIPGQGLDLSKVSPDQLKLLQQQDPGAVQRGAARFAGATPAPAESNPIEGMMQHYATLDERAQANKATRDKQFEDLLRQQMEQSGSAGPSKAEMYFNLAAAFGAPTKTGSFMESMGNASQVLGAHSKAQREAEAAGRAERQKLGMTVAQMRAQDARQEASDVRSMRNELMKDYLKSGQPQSEAGKIAVDSGFKKGTPEYAEFVTKYIAQKLESGDMYKNIMAGVAQTNAGIAQQRLEMSQAEAKRKEAEGKKLTGPEMKLKTETEDILAQTDQAFKNLQRAIELNPNTFGSALGDKVQRTLLENTSPKDPKVVATREMENLLEKAALASLKSTFPGAISNDERKALQDVQGIGAKSPDERATIMKAASKALQAVYKRHKQRLADINAGQYRQTTPEIEQEGTE